jgi:hypothetical protein
MFLEQNAWVSQKQDARWNLVVAALQASFLLSEPCGRHLLCTSVGLVIPFFLTKILELTLSCVSQATQYSPSMKSQKDIQLVNKVDCCLSEDSFLAHASLQGNSADLPRYEYFAAGFQPA